MESQQIRARFLQFFLARGHSLKQAVPIVNKEDPTLFFVNAGMNPFKELILGHQPITEPRVASAQPCLRVSGKHNDLEEVGIDSYHHTLFEMLGNWSFGDYFKEQAIQWAWELLTDVYQIPKAQLYVTTFAGDHQDQLQADHEAEAIWAQYLPKTHILPFGKKDNFWEMGAQGPCGPCSEIHVDIRPQAARDAVPAAQWVNKDHPQVLEIWNLVFMQYNRLASGQLVNLPHKHIDTGMGFERLAMVLQGKTSSYDTDIFSPLIQELAHISGKSYDQSPEIAIAMRVVADHLRAIAFAIADGQPPAHSKAGYVIRRILRRAIRYGYSHLGINHPFIHSLSAVLIDQLGAVYPGLLAQRTYIQQVIAAEEHAFLKTLAAGLHRLSQLRETPEETPGEPSVITGSVAFELYDTHGFPLDLTLLIAKEQGRTVDEVAFHEKLQQQKLRSQKAAAISYGDWHVVQNVQEDRPFSQRAYGEEAKVAFQKKSGDTHFVGYDQTTLQTTIVQWRTIQDQRGTFYQVVLAETPFYPEGGGQVADSGVIIVGDLTIPVVDVQKEHGQILHTLAPVSDLNPGTGLGILGPGLDLVEARVDTTKRHLTANNHSATHLLQAALRQILGKQVTQKGSMVTPNLLRFDFSYPHKLTPAELKAVEALVNQKIRANISCVEKRELPIEAAKAMGAQALFGEKYGANVRVITFDPDFSIELCGGTHVKATGQMGWFKIISETAVGSGIRRIEAITATKAEDWASDQFDQLKTIATLLKQPKDPVKAVETHLQEKQRLEKALKAYQAKEVAQVVEALKGKIEKVGANYCLIQAIQLSHIEALKQVALQCRAYATPITIVLAAACGDQVQLTVCLSQGATPPLPAGDLIQAIAPLIGGHGGGQALFATASGNKPAGITAALQKARALWQG